MMLICSNVLKDIGLSVLFVTVAEEEKPFSKYMCNCLSPYHYTWLKKFKFITKEKKSWQVILKLLTIFKTNM